MDWLHTYVTGYRIISHDVALFKIELAIVYKVQADYGTTVVARSLPYPELLVH